MPDIEWSCTYGFEIYSISRRHYIRYITSRLQPAPVLYFSTAFPHRVITITHASCIYILAAFTSPSGHDRNFSLIRYRASQSSIKWQRRVPPRYTYFRVLSRLSRVVPLNNACYRMSFSAILTGDFERAPPSPRKPIVYTHDILRCYRMKRKLRALSSEKRSFPLAFDYDTSLGWHYYVHALVATEERERLYSVNIWTAASARKARRFPRHSCCPYHIISGTSRSVLLHYLYRAYTHWYCARSIPHLYFILITRNNI